MEGVSEHREPFGVGGREGVIVVLLGKLHEDRLGVGAFARSDEELAQSETDTSTGGSGGVFVGVEESDGVEGFALGREDASAQGDGEEPVGLGGLGTLGSGVGVGELALLEEEVSACEVGGGGVDSGELTFGAGVIGGANGIEGGGEGRRLLGGGGGLDTGESEGEGEEMTHDVGPLFRDGFG
jgi:hypothetical protein